MCFCVYVQVLVNIIKYSLWFLIKLKLKKNHRQNRQVCVCVCMCVCVCVCVRIYDVYDKVKEKTSWYMGSGDRVKSYKRHKNGTWCPPWLKLSIIIKGQWSNPRKGVTPSPTPQCHHHHVVPLARISMTLSRYFSLSFIASGRTSGLHPVSSHSCCIYVRTGRPAFARPYVGVHRKTSLMSSSLHVCLVYLG